MKYTIAVELIGKLEKEVAKINRKLSKAGEDAVVFSVGEPYLIEYTERIDKRDPLQGSFKKERRVVDVEVEGKYQISGFEIVAVLEYSELNNMSVVYQIEDCEIPEIYFTRTACDHCNSSRRRLHTVLLRNIETGEFKQVGKACLKDYLGCDIEQYASYLAFFKTFEDLCEMSVDAVEERFGISAVLTASVETVLLQACAFVRTEGFHSKKEVREREIITESESEIRATSERVIDALMEHNLLTVTNEDKEMKEELITYIDSLNDDEIYNVNVKNLIKNKKIELKFISMLIGTIGRFLASRREVKAATESLSSYIGEIGERIEFTATPKLIYSADSDYGIFRIYQFMKGEDVIIWKTSKELEEKEMTFKGTVKSHQEFKGIKQTEITRAKVVA